MSAEWEESGERRGIARDCQGAGSGLDRGGKQVRGLLVAVLIIALVAAIDTWGLCPGNVRCG